MKKILCSLAILATFAFGARADEGMWLLPLLEQMNGKAMADLGCRLTPDQIYSINHSSLKDAIVQFGGGCTGEMISQQGLLITNHHCGYSNIQALSTPEHNYLEDGFFAMNRNQEIPVPGLSVTFLESMTDVTDAITKAADQQAARQQLISQAQAANPGCRVTVSAFYNQNVFYLIVYKTYTDVRFVGAPPAALGKFGGETDNWEWPRHTCDFSMFRVYADKNNQPAAYAATNVPYTPKQSLKVSLRGVKEGDFTFIMGYPGSTQRFQTADQLEAMMDRYGIAVKARTTRLGVMWAGMETDPTIRLQYANKYAGSANGWKKWQGEQLSFDKLNIIGRERQKEADFMAWVNQDPARKAKYGDALKKISEAVAANRQMQHDNQLFSESVSTIGPLSIFSTVQRLLSAGGAAGRPGGAPPQGAPQGARPGAAPQAPMTVDAVIDRAVQSFKDYNDPLERQMALAMLEFYRDNADPKYYLTEIGDFATMDLEKYVDYLFDNTKFSSGQKLLSYKGSAADKLLDPSDPVAVLYRDMAAVSAKISASAQAPAAQTSAKLQEGSKEFGAGLLEWKKGEPSYPDANSTMRLTYGTVMPYSPRDGVSYWYYTTLNGVIEKEDPDNYEFRVPAKIKELYKAKDYGQYADKNGELPACFLTNGDITGGNSGSPVMDADGCLIGLAFDGNWESMSSDVMFEPVLTRCINVDIRYVLFVIDKFGGAGYLLNEMELVR